MSQVTDNVIKNICSAQRLPGCEVMTLLSMVMEDDLIKYLEQPQQHLLDAVGFELRLQHLERERGRKRESG